MLSFILYMSFVCIVVSRIYVHVVEVFEFNIVVVVTQTHLLLTKGVFFSRSVSFSFMHV